MPFKSFISLHIGLPGPVVQSTTSAKYLNSTALLTIHVIIACSRISIFLSLILSLSYSLTLSLSKHTLWITERVHYEDSIYSQIHLLHSTNSFLPLLYPPLQTLLTCTLPNFESPYDTFPLLTWLFSTLH
jgi:hypothetical protein